MSGWASVSDGKWHRTVNDAPSDPRRTEKALCGIVFHPLNVMAAGEQPHVHDQYRCQRCERIVRAALNLHERVTRWGNEDAAITATLSGWRRDD